MKAIARILRWFVLATLALWIAPSLLFSTVSPSEIGVRQSALSGVVADDFEPGWVLRIPGIHKVIHLPRKYLYLDYAAEESGKEQLQIRTKDNNIVYIDVSVPYRIKPGEAWEVVQAGNHQLDADGAHRFQRLAAETTVSVLREELAALSSADFYSTDRRVAVAEDTLVVLNEKLAPIHLEAERILIRAVQFRPEYERQLQQIQLNEQKKLLDEASEIVAREQQKLDNYVEATNALAASLEQRWIERRSGLERAYQVGFIDVEGDTTPGAARKRLAALSETERAAIVAEAAKALNVPEDQVDSITDDYLLGIRNIEAETLEYDQRTRTEADGIAGRLAAEGAALVATVRGEFEAKINALLDSSAGRAYVAWKSADNVKFADNLYFHSGDGVPSVLKLRRLAEEFMGQR